jgi:hypothetical protein
MGGLAVAVPAISGDMRIGRASADRSLFRAVRFHRQSNIIATIVARRTLAGKACSPARWRWRSLSDAAHLKVTERRPRRRDAECRVPGGLIVIRPQWVTWGSVCGA